MKPFEQQTYYELLEIPVSAPDTEIRAAYARALETYSPDSVAVYALVDPGQIDALRARLTEAMEILTEPELRAEYDQMIGVGRTGANTLAAPAPELVAPVPVAKPEAPVAAAPEKPAASEPPVAATPPAAPAPASPAEPVTRPVAEALQSAASESLPTREAPPVEAPAPVASTAPSASVPESAPAQAPEPSAMLMVTPSQVHAAFRSYAISYVPVVVPAPAVPSAAVVSAFKAPEPAAAPVPAPGTPREPVASAPATPTEAQEPVPAVPPPVSAAEPPPPVAPVASPPAEPAPAAAAVRPPPTSSARARVSMTPPPLPPGNRRPGRSAPTPPPVAPAPGSARASAAASDRNLGEAQQLAQESAIATAEAALAQVAAKAREPRPKPLDLPPNTEFNGEVLRQVRESRGLSLQQLAERTRISSKHLENVEADRYTALPAQVYLRGFLMSMARELGLDPLKVSRSYLTLASAPQKK